MRCAIYTRKSADEAQDSQFSSLESQRDLCGKYIASQVGEGWLALSTHYDDPGYSGGNLKRPALDQLLADIDRNLIDIIVVYKIDRLSRSLRDFLDLIAVFEARNVTFVAVTQSFNTTNSMGRLMLNVLLSFAQFEREITAERLRDWFAGARSRGLWTSGSPPFGYDVKDLRLYPRQDQAEIVRHIFKRYSHFGSARLVADELNAQGSLNKFGRPWSKRVITEILQNRVYRGELVHYGRPQDGAHEAIITETEYQHVQRVIAASARRRAALRRPAVNGMLKGLLFGEDGERLIHVFLHRRGRTYRYYIPSIDRYRSDGHRYRASDLESSVLSLLEKLVGTPQPRDEFIQTGHVRRLVSRIDITPNTMRVSLTTGAILSSAHGASIKARTGLILQ